MKKSEELKKNISEGKNLRNKVYANYVLALAGEPDINSLHFIYQNLFIISLHIGFMDLSF